MAPVADLSLSDLQQYVNKRADAKVCPVTIRKEIATLRAVWNWGEPMGLTSGKFPNRGLRYPKADEKPPFSDGSQSQPVTSTGDDVWIGAETSAAFRSTKERNFRGAKGDITDIRVTETAARGERMSTIGSRIGVLDGPSSARSASPELSEERQPRCSVTVIVPALNESGAIGQVVRDLAARYPEYEILVIDDGSEDNTGELAAAAGASVIRHEWNRGYGASLRTGCRHARGDIVVCFDGDGQHDAGDVERIVDQIGPYDMVVGTRSHDSHEPLVRRPGKLVLTVFANFLAGVKIPDVNSGLRVQT